MEVNGDSGNTGPGGLKEDKNTTIGQATTMAVNGDSGNTSSGQATTMAVIGDSGNTGPGGVQENEKEEAPPPAASSSDKCPPLSPLPHRRVRSSQSQISALTMDAGPWDSKVTADAIEQAGGMNKAPSSRVARRMTLADINEVSPMEAEAETHLLKALEEKEGHAQVQDIILPHVPDEGLDAFEGTPIDSLSGAGEHQRFQDAADQVRSSKTDTKGKLAGLTHAMRLLQGSSAPKKNDGSHDVQQEISSFIEPVEQEIPISDADVFFQNAQALFRRSRSGSKQKERKEGSPSNESNVVVPSSSDDVEHGVVSPSTSNETKHNRRGQIKYVVADTGHGIKTEMGLLHDFLEPRKASMFTYTKWMMIVFIIPLALIAVILFYGAGNPMLRDTGASVSWLCLFIARNIITFSMAKGAEIFAVNYLCLRTKLTGNLFGPNFALLMVQSKGYPAILTAYGFISMIMLSGYNDFVKHWLFYQEAIKVFNASNPAGTVSESRIYVGVLGCCILCGCAVTVKRHFLGLRLGKRAYCTYGDKLAKVMSNIVLVSEVAALSKQRPDQSDEDLKIDLSFDTSESPQKNSNMSAQPDVRGASLFYNSLNDSQRQLIMQQLESWEEPVLGKNNATAQVSITAVLQFRQALSLADNRFVFSTDFGPADKREACITSSQKVYERLLRREGSGEVLHFNSIAQIAIKKDGRVNKEKLKELVHLFRPSRDGELTMIDFIKSIDAIYKEFRILQASIENSGTVDRAFELLVNWAFYIVLWCIMLYIVGISPVALLVSFSSFIVGFAFMIGNASSKYFEGLLFILVRRPYDIGDRIAVSDPETDTSLNGSTTWFVEDLGLYSTTVRLAATNEVATYSNGSLANSRIINAARSHQAVVSVYAKFGVSVKFAKVQLFKRAVEKFVKERPREWLNLLGFRATRVEQDLGFIEYVVVLQHRESWQNIGAILCSKAEVTSFSLEVAKQLGMRYSAPPLPVSLTMSQGSGQSTTRGDRTSIASVDLRGLIPQTGAVDLASIASEELHDFLRQTGAVTNKQAGDD